MKTVTLTKARYSLKDLVRRASVGESFILTERGRECAAIVPLSKVACKSKEEIDEFMKGIDKLQKEMTAAFKKKNPHKTTTQIIREDRLSH